MHVHLSRLNPCPPTPFIFFLLWSYTYFSNYLCSSFCCTVPSDTLLCLSFLSFSSHLFAILPQSSFLSFHFLFNSVSSYPLSVSSSFPSFPITVYNPLPAHLSTPPNPTSASSLSFLLPSLHILDISALFFPPTPTPPPLPLHYIPPSFYSSK